MMNPSASGDAQPELPPAEKNRLMPATPSAINAAPTQSIRPGDVRAGSSVGTAAQQSTMPSTPMTPISMKID